jgi:hypothetical protein
MSARHVPRLIALVGVLAVGSSTAAWAGDVPFDGQLLETASINLSPVPATQGPPAAPPAPHIALLDLVRVPKEAIPPYLEPPSASSRVAEGTFSPSLRFADVTRAQLAHYKTKHEPLEVHIESAEPGAGGGYFIRNGAMPSPTPKLTTTCTKDSNVVGLRWERARLSEKGELTLDIDDGWFDPLNCSLSIERRTTLHPVVVHADRGLPLAFALRSETELTLFFAPGTNVAADATGKLGQGNGALRRVTLPLERGGAASVLTSVSATHLAEWRLRAMGRDVPQSGSAGDVAITLGVDAVQTVSDVEPSVTVRSFEQTIGQGVTFREPRRFPRKSMLPRR